MFLWDRTNLLMWLGYRQSLLKVLWRGEIFNLLERSIFTSFHLESSCSTYYFGPIYQPHLASFVHLHRPNMLILCQQEREDASLQHWKQVRGTREIELHAGLWSETVDKQRQAIQQPWLNLSSIFSISLWSRNSKFSGCSWPLWGIYIFMSVGVRRLVNCTGNDVPVRVWGALCEWHNQTTVSKV